MPERVDIRVLGPLEIDRGGARVAVRRAKVRELLVLLLVRRGSVVPTDVLIDALWGEEAPPTARNTLQVYVMHLRKILAEDPTAHLDTRDAGYVLDIDPERVDLFRFGRLVDEGAAALGEGDPRRAEALLGEALGLWRGRPFEGIDVPGLPLAELADLQERHHAALALHLETELALGRHLEVVQEIEGARAERPHDERLAALAALALYRSGRQADALEICAKLRRALSEELGIEPGPAIARLERQILEHDPALDAPGPSEAGPEREARRVVTGLICRLSVSGAEGSDPEAQREALATAVRTAREIVGTHGGRVGEVLGARVAALFGVAVVHEDDPLRAIRAAVELRGRVGEESDERGIQARIGVATGEVLVRETGRDRSLLSAEPLDVADQLARAARPGEILLSPATWRLTHDAVDAEPAELLVLPDDAPPISAFRLVDVAEATQPGRRLSSPLVGRRPDLAVLLQAADRAEREHTASLVTVLGPAGVGKSRLVAELVASIGDRATVLAGHCLPYGRDITLWPVAEIVRAAARIPLGAPPEEVTAKLTRFLGDAEVDEADLVTEQLLAVLGLTEVTTATEDIAWAFRGFLLAAAHDRPLVVVVDDLHWAEATLLDLLEQVVASARDAALLVVCMARPELVEQSPTWGAGRLDATNLTLGPLKDEESAELLDNLLGKAELDPAARLRIMDAAEGHPLFLEELLAMLIEDEQLRWQDGRWVPSEDLREVPIPPTVQALLEARLDRLPGSERVVLEHAAIVGRVFSEADLEALGPVDGLAAALAALARRDLIVLERLGRAGRSFRFRHILIRDAVYRGIPKRTRAEGHAAFGTYLEDRAGERIAEIDEVVGYHLEAASRYRRDLGLPDEGDPPLAARAAERLTSAGRRAFGRDDMPAAAGLLDRALALLGEDDPRVPELSWRRVVALADMGRFVDAEAEMDRGEQAADRLGDVRWGWRLRMERTDIGFWRDPNRVDAAHLELVAGNAMRELEPLGDRAGMARACRLMAEAMGCRGRYVEVMDWIAAGREHALAAGDERELREKQGAGGVHGPVPADRCIEHLQAGIERDRRLNPDSLGALGFVLAMVDRADESHSAFERGLERARDLGVEWKAADVLMHRGAACLMTNDAAAAEASLRPAVESLQRMGEQGMMSTAVALLAEALYRLGRDDEAMLATIASETATAKDDVASQMAWRGVRAKVLARRGDLWDAERLAREAVAFADQTDLLSMAGDAHVDLAVVLERAGRPDEAAEELGRAIELFERKGNLVSARRAKAMLTELSGTAKLRT